MSKVSYMHGTKPDGSPANKAPIKVPIHFDRYKALLNLPTAFELLELSKITSLFKMIKDRPEQNKAACETLNQFFPTWIAGYKERFDQAVLKQWSAAGDAYFEIQKVKKEKAALDRVNKIFNAYAGIPKPKTSKKNIASFIINNTALVKELKRDVKVLCRENLNGTDCLMIGSRRWLLILPASLADSDLSDYANSLLGAPSLCENLKSGERFMCGKGSTTFNSFTTPFAIDVTSLLQTGGTVDAKPTLQFYEQGDEVAAVYAVNGQPVLFSKKQLDIFQSDFPLGKTTGHNKPTLFEAESGVKLIMHPLTPSDEEKESTELKAIVENCLSAETI